MAMRSHVLIISKRVLIVGFSIKPKTCVRPFQQFSIGDVVQPTALKLRTGGMAHSIKLMKTADIENFINIIAKSAAENAIKELAKMPKQTAS